MKKWIDFLPRQVHVVHFLQLRVAGHRVSVVEAFGQIVLGLRCFVDVVLLVVFAALAGPVEAVVAAHWEDGHLAWTASVARRSAARCSVPVSVLPATPSPSSRLVAPHLGD